MTATTARVTRTRGIAMREVSVAVGGRSRMGAGGVGVGVVGGVAAGMVIVEEVVEVTLWGGPWMLGGRDIAAVPQVVLDQMTEHAGMGHHRLGDGVKSFHLFVRISLSSLPSLSSCDWR